MSLALLWFRRDLRLHDNPALLAALAAHRQLVLVYIHDPDAEAPWQAGAASRWWLHHSLAALDKSLAQRGARLILRQGDSQSVLQTLIKECGATHIYWNRLYEPACIPRDSAIKIALQAQGIQVSSHNSALLFEPWQVVKPDSTPYRVFTPFWKTCQRLGLERQLQAAPEQIPSLDGPDSLPLDALQLQPRLAWADGFTHSWTPGEDGALQAMELFMDTALSHYAEGRDRPAQPGTARLSPHLHFGEISPARLVQAVMQTPLPSGHLADAETWLRELGWREFAHYLLYHFPETATQPFDPRFTDFRWEHDPQGLQAWQRGQTGFPIIDAGMRELWHTGWMHNRVRMIVASLLSKNLLIPWQAGAAWFWDTLLDADLAANTLGWQWTAGCGADAAPWFRIFNPVLQGQKFDPQGTYVRRWVPELAALPNKHLHQPWRLSAAELVAYGLKLGEDYPSPIVDLSASRQRALARFDAIKQGTKSI
ncbi:MAG: cryptochrome/photolyase family protein [Thiohalomonadaceae bacterium]